MYDPQLYTKSTPALGREEGDSNTLLGVKRKDKSPQKVVLTLSTLQTDLV